MARLNATEARLNVDRHKIKLVQPSTSDIYKYIRQISMQGGAELYYAIDERVEKETLDSIIAELTQNDFGVGQAAPSNGYFNLKITW